MVNKRIEENDIYALKIIDNKSKYLGRYIILIKSKVDKWPKLINKNLFRFKISKTDNIPSLEEIESLEYVKTCFTNYISAVSRPLKRSDINQEYIDKIKLAKDIADEYGYYYTYLCEIMTFDKSMCENILYIGNKEITKPKNEFIPDNVFHVSVSHTFPLDIVDFVLDSYDKYNLKNAVIFKEGMNSKILKSEFKNIMFYFNVVDMVNHDIAEGKNYKYNGNNSLTYVGVDDEELFEE